MDVGVGASIAFWLFSGTAVAGAAGVILLRDIFRAAVMLVLAFLSVAGIFVTLSADFIAAVQVLIYGGAVSILIIFAVLLTRDVQSGNPNNRFQLPGIFVGMGLLGALILGFVKADWRISEAQPIENTTAAIGDVLLKSWVLPFEIASFLLLAVMIGAIVLAKGEED